jgi:hypothetical protein
MSGAAAVDGTGVAAGAWLIVIGMIGAGSRRPVNPRNGMCPVKISANTNTTATASTVRMAGEAIAFDNAAPQAEAW